MAKQFKDTILADWKKEVFDFKGKVNNALDEIHKCKQQIAALKAELVDESTGGQYIRDNECIILSAPKIIIGNVEKSGELKGGGEIIIRGGKLGIDGVGSGGSINLRANAISQIAVDPGIDGKEAVVYENSSIISQARSILIDSKSPVIDAQKKGTFLSPKATEGITISAEKGITVAATLGNTKKKEAIKVLKDSLNKEKSDLTTSIGNIATAINEDITNINAILKDQTDLEADDVDLRKTNILAIDELNVRLKTKIPFFYKHMIDYANDVSRLAEVERELANLTSEDSAVDSAKANFDKETTGSKLSLKGEQINVHSVDGDGNWRTNPEAAIDIRGNYVKVHTHEKDEKLAAKGRVDIEARNVKVSTRESNDLTYDENSKIKTGKFPLATDGKILLESRTLNFDSTSYEQTDVDKFKETELKMGSSFDVRTENINFNTNDAEGKAVGKFKVNTKKIRLQSLDVEHKKEMSKDELGNFIVEKDKAGDMAEASVAYILSENISVGYKNSEKKSKERVAKMVQIMAEESTKLLNKKMATVGTIGDKKSFVCFKDGKASLGGDKTILSGELTVEGKATIKDKLTGTEIEAKNVTASGTLKGSNLQDGMGTPVQGNANPEKLDEKPEEVDKDKDGNE